MTKEELKEHCEKQIKVCEDWAKATDREPSGNIYEEHKLVLDLIKALEQQPCDDCVSRQAVDQNIYDYAESNGLSYANLKNAILDVPTVTPNSITVTDFADKCRECGARYGRLLEQSRWIPVSEKLPASDEDVLVTNGKGMYIGWIDPTDKCWRVDSESEYFMNDIVAWQPLPKPYEEKRGDEE